MKTMERGRFRKRREKCLVSFHFFLPDETGQKTFKIFVPKKKKKKKMWRTKGKSKDKERAKEKGRRVDSEEKLEFGSREAK